MSTDKSITLYNKKHLVYMPTYITSPRYTIPEILQHLNLHPNI